MKKKETLINLSAEASGFLFAFGTSAATKQHPKFVRDNALDLSNRLKACLDEKIKKKS